MKNTNCEFKIIPLPVTSISKTSNIVKLGGIENPYPKLYVYKNDLTKSLNPCSSIENNESTIVENGLTRIISIAPENDKNEDYKITPADKTNRQNLYKIKNNLYGPLGAPQTNVTYNFCSNDFKYYKNKMYNYDYDITRYYYYAQNNDLHNSKNRIVLDNLTSDEIKLYENIENLLIGVNLVGNNNKILRNINNKGNLTQYSEIWANDNNSVNESFKIEWDSTKEFKNGIQINLKKSDGKYLHDIEIPDNIFNTNPDLISIIKNILGRVNEKIRTDILEFANSYNSSNQYLEFSINYTEGGWDEETNTFKDNIIKYPSESTDTNCIKQPYNNKTRREAALNLLNFVKKIENNELIKTRAGNIRYLLNRPKS